MEVNYNCAYLTDHLITYIGNKRKLLPFIDAAITEIKTNLGQEHLSIFDGFSGSGTVARLFKHYASELYVNDLEGYSETVNQCYLANKSEVALAEVTEQIDHLNSSKLDEMEIGFIEKHYAPVNDDVIEAKERVFYTNRNAKIIDNVRRLISQIAPALVPFCLAPLLVKASIHNNTSGVFKGFHKKDGVGHFGGAGENALARIKKEIQLDYPVFCERECPYTIIKGDINEVIKQLPDLDVVYYDPPYNQHPYGSNYFMLNIINEYNAPAIQDEGVSGIAREWNKSDYNSRYKAEKALDDLIGNTPAKYVMISYNSEGIIPVDEFSGIVRRHGKVDLNVQNYNTYRGAKNLGKNKRLKDGQSRSLTVDEMLWVIRKP